MKIYVGTKIIQAEPCTEGQFRPLVEGSEDRPGYKVIYPDGYVSWSPKETFEVAYREATREEKIFIWQDH